jgi:Mycobacterium membrane protein
VIEGSVTDVDQDWSDFASAEGRYASQTSPTADAHGASRKGRRNQRIGVFGALRRLWIPLVMVAVLAGGGFAVSRLHGLFGSDTSVPYSDTRNNTKPFNPKRMRYELFGPPGTVAQISYFDESGDPKHEGAVTLPWSLEFPLSTAAGIGSIAAQGDSSTIGCRIMVDGVVKAENTSTHEVSSFVSCMLKAA